MHTKHYDVYTSRLAQHHKSKQSLNVQDNRRYTTTSTSAERRSRRHERTCYVDNTPDLLWFNDPTSTKQPISTTPRDRPRRCHLCQWTRPPWRPQQSCQRWPFFVDQCQQSVTNFHTNHRHARQATLPSWTLGRACQRARTPWRRLSCHRGYKTIPAHSTSRRLTHNSPPAPPTHGSRRERGAGGAVRAVASGPTPDAAWALLGDFCSLHQWVSTVRACRRVDGDDEQGSVVRYCEGPVNMAAPAAGVGWSKERLLEMDHARRSYSYELMDSNKGFGRYRATVRVEEDPAGCAVAWSFEADPVKGWTQEGFVGFLEKLARGVARRLEEETSTR